MGKKRVLVMGNLGRDVVRETIGRICGPAEKLAAVVQADLECEQPVPAGPVDLAVVVGGDGSILKASRCLAPAGIPCLGVNIGRLGFLAAFREEELAEQWDEILEGGGRRVERIMLAVQIDKRSGHHSREVALNDVVVAHGASHRLIGVTVEVAHEPVTEYRGDGVVVATPTGSTAYNLAAGGPILEGRLNAFVVTPISPHMLTNRSIVIGADTAVTLRPTEDQRDATCIIDGQIVVPMVSGDVVHITKSPHRFVLVENPTRSAFETLSEKLHWGHPPRYGT